ncbi:hypothetical protein BGZ98_002848 [Dissophora globulifera]|nr:hypothetical protein BGZ98_002848 [Dissophora globulifera]
MARGIVSRAHCPLPMTSHPLTAVISPRTHVALRFSTSSSIALTFKKVPLNKKITLPKDPYLLSEKVIKFSNNGKLDDAITLVMESPVSRQSEVVWNHLIQESSKLGKTNQAWQLLSDMKKRGFEPNSRTYTILLNALAINSSSPNSVQRAKALYQEMQENEDTSPTVVHTNALLKVCARKENYKTLQQIYNDMPKSGSNAPDVVSFNITINAFARMGGDAGFEMAWKVWEDCLQAKTRRPDEIELDEVLIDSILMACRQANSSAFIRRGLSIVESLYGFEFSSGQKSKNGTESTGAGTESESFTGDMALSPGKALGLGHALKQKIIHPRTVELVLSICTKLKNYTQAQTFMDAIYTTYPDFKPDSQLISSMIHLHITVKEYEKAIRIWDKLGELGLEHTPATFRQGLDAASKAKNWDKTMEMYTIMRDMGKKNRKASMRFKLPLQPVVFNVDAWTLVSTLKCAFKTRHYAEAVKILRESRWEHVVMQPKYPRANADLAELAVKVFVNALTAERKLKGDTSTKETYLLEKELQDARSLHTRLVKALLHYDEDKERRNAVEKTEARNWKRKFRDAVQSTELDNAQDEQSEDAVPGSAMQEGFSDYKQMSSEFSGRSDFRPKTARPSTFAGRSSRGNSQRRKPSVNASADGPRRKRSVGGKSSTDTFSDAFRRSKTFTRSVGLD